MDDGNTKLITLSKILPIIATLISIIGIVIPIAGFSFEQGYLSVFGISSEVFLRDLSESWGQSFYIVLIALVFLYKNYFWFSALIIGGIVFIALVVIFILSFVKKETLKSFFSKLEDFKNQEAIIGNAIYVVKCMYTDFKWLFNSVYFLFCSLILFLIVLMLPFQHGREVAQKHYDEFSEHQCEKEIWSRCMQIQDANSNIILYEGFLVAGTGKYIALYDGKKTKVIPRLNNYLLIRYKSLEE